MDQLDLRAVMADQFPAFLADRVRHDNDRPVSADGSDKRQADPLVAAGRFDNNAVRADQAFLLRLQEHIHRGPGLNGSADVQRFHLHQDLRAVLPREFVQPDDRRVTDRFQNILTDQWSVLRSCWFRILSYGSLLYGSLSGNSTISIGKVCFFVCLPGPDEMISLPLPQIP